MTTKLKTLLNGARHAVEALNHDTAEAKDCYFGFRHVRGLLNTLEEMRAADVDGEFVAALQELEEHLRKLGEYFKRLLAHYDEKTLGYVHAQENDAVLFDEGGEEDLSMKAAAKLAKADFNRKAASQLVAAAQCAFARLDRLAG